MIYSRKKFLIPEIFILLFPLSLITGPLIPEILMNTVSLFFLFFLFISKDYKILNNKFFYYYLAFVTYIIFNSYFSIYNELIFLDNLFYFRFLIFVFAVYFFFLKNPKLIIFFFYSLLLIFSVLIIDGFIEFFYGRNSLGAWQYRPDRISSFFGDKLVLGSFISKYFFMLIGLFFFLKDKMNKAILITSLIIISFSFVLIFLSGERSVFFASIMGIIILFITLNISIYKKFYIFLISILVVTATFSYNTKLYDRYVDQTVSQLSIFDIKKKEQNFFDRFKYYRLIFNTAYKGFLDKKLFGQGPKSFRYFCSEDHLVTISKRKFTINNEILYFKAHKKVIHVKVDKIYVSKGQKLSKGDLVFSYVFNGEIKKFFSSREGLIKDIKVDVGQSINIDFTILNLDLTGTDIPKISTYNPNGCTTHPHQFYLQLLSETGIVGTIFIFFNFIYISFILVRFLFNKIFRKVTELNNTQICLITNFIVILFPLITNGNFFNNWLNMTFLIQIAFSLFYF